MIAAVDVDYVATKIMEADKKGASYHDLAWAAIEAIRHLSAQEAKIDVAWAEPKSGAA